MIERANKNRKAREMKQCKKVNFQINVKNIGLKSIWF